MEIHMRFKGVCMDVNNFRQGVRRGKMLNRGKKKNDQDDQF